MVARVKGPLALLVLAVAAIEAAPVLAQSVRSLGEFNQWSAYTTSEGASKICFAISKPSSVTPEPDGYTQAYLYLTHRPGEGTRNEFNLVAGHRFAPDSTASASIGGTRFPLFTEADGAWLENPAQGDAVASAMRAGSTLLIEGTTEAGTDVSHSYSLSGVTAATRAIDAECAG